MQNFKPIGRLDADFDTLYAAGCIQTGADTCTKLEQAKRDFSQMFEALSTHTGNNICDGCPALKGGNCKVFKKYHTSCQKAVVEDTMATVPKGTRDYPGLTVAEIAKKLGISKNEVRRRKMRGEI